MSKQRSLDWWLNHLSRVHPATMALGLERVGEVCQRLGAQRPAPMVITVAGTNGKGSSCAMLGAILRAAGRRVGSFSSPHLFTFNERISTTGLPIDDQSLISALERVELARGEIPLTYFEYAALAALVEFQQKAVDVAVLEVGLGGRLDAVNVVDPDVALITNIGLDHTQWLGNTLDLIAVEKAGIFRKGQVAICAQPDAPQGLHRAASKAGVRWRVAGKDFRWRKTEAGWDWQQGPLKLTGLPLPTLAGNHQLTNAAGCLAALNGAGLMPERGALEQGIRSAGVMGRLWQVSKDPAVVLDVGHNPAAAKVIGAWLADYPCQGRTFVVAGMLKDKAAHEMVLALAAQVDQFIFCGLPGSRGQSARQLRSRVRIPGLKARLAETPAQALDLALNRATASDRVLVLGSFVTVELAARHLGLV